MAPHAPTSIGLGELVSVLAMRVVARMIRLDIEMLLRCQRPQVGWVHAGLVAAPVMEVIAFWNSSDEEVIEQAVRHPVTAAVLVPTANAQCSIAPAIASAKPST